MNQGWYTMNQIPNNGVSFDNDYQMNSEQLKLGNSTVQDDAILPPQGY